MGSQRRLSRVLFAIVGVAGLLLALMAATHGSLFGIDGDTLFFGGLAVFAAWAIFAFATRRRVT